MSVVETHEFVNDLNETDFPYLNSKSSSKRAEKGRRSGADNATIMKTIHDPQHVLGKRRKARLTSTCDESLAAGVPYSINRKNRWEQVDNILTNADATEVEVAVVEQNVKPGDFFCAAPNATSVQLLKSDGSIRRRQAKGQGAAACSLFHSLKQDGDEDGSQDHARIEYQITRPASQHGSGKSHRRARKNRRPKLFDLDDFEGMSEMENSVHVEDNNVYKPSRDFKFCLGDYIQESQTAAVVRRQSIENVQNPEITDIEVEQQELETVRPFDLLDISSIQKVPSVFEMIWLKSSTWSSFNFNEQVDKLCSEGKFAVKWIDVNHQRASVDLTQHLTKEPTRPELFIVLEKARKGNFQMIINTTIAQMGPISARSLVNRIKSTKSESIEGCLEQIVEIIGDWRSRQIFNSNNTEDRLVSNPDNYRRGVNSEMMAKTATPVTEEEMRSLLRDKSQNQDEDPFERISDVSLASDSEHEEYEAVQEIPFVRNCHTCTESNVEELFELDEYWQCRQCLRQLIVSQIRTKTLPLNIPFVLDLNGSSFDVLPSLIPLPLINFYTKMAALELMRCSDIEIGDILECPGCRRPVKVERPNEYRSCSCVGCGVTWCPECLCEPHWPMTCEQFAEWSPKWDKQYAVEILKDDTSEFIRRVICECGNTVDAGDMSEKAECQQCGAKFNPKTLKKERSRYYPYKARARKYHIFVNSFEKKDLNARMVQHVPVQCVIKKDIAEPCMEARQLRFSSIVDVMKKCRKMKDVEPSLQNFPKLRTTILCLAEFGLGWVYVEKGSQTLKSAIMQLFRQCEEITSLLDNSQPKLGQRVSVVEQSLSKLLEQIKNALQTSVHM